MKVNGGEVGDQEKPEMEHDENQYPFQADFSTFSETWESPG